MSDQETTKEYLGDSVYVDVDAFGCLRLTTENGYGPSNTIILEPEVYLALTRYSAQWLQICRGGRPSRRSPDVPQP